MMKKRRSTCLLSLGILALCPVLSNATEETERACNLQGRELALRASETLLPALDAEARRELARLAEEICLDYAGLQTSDNGQPPEVSGVDVEGDDSGLSGLFSDITIVDPQNRVRRPGLKRP